MQYLLFENFGGRTYSVTVAEGGSIVFSDVASGSVRVTVYDAARNVDFVHGCILTVVKIGAAVEVAQVSNETLYQEGELQVDNYPEADGAHAPYYGRDQQGLDPIGEPPYEPQLR